MKSIIIYCSIKYTPVIICVMVISAAVSLFGALGVQAQSGGAAALVISEFRFRGYFGPNDEYIELYNNSDADITVNAADGSSGWTLVEYGGYPLASLPNGTVIRARAHFLAANYYQSTRSVVRLYDCCSYVNYGYADGHEIAVDRGVAIFATSNPANFTQAYKLDSAGFSNIAGGPFREGVGLPPIGSTPGEYAFVRRANGLQLQDTDDNLADFQFVSTTGGIWNGIQSVLGGPAPESVNSARRGNLPGNALPAASLLDTNVQPHAQPNESRDYQPVGNGAQGTLEIRRKITNTTGAPITKLRLRVTDITGYPAMSGMADLRVLSSTDTSVQLSNGATVAVKGTTVDQALTQFLGGGLNSSLSVALAGGSLAAGASVNIRIVFGVMQTGDYRFETDIPLGNTQGTITPGSSTASIFGKVGNTSDGPTAGFGGVIVTLSGSQSATTVTDANGNYAFNNLAPGGSYSVAPSKSGFTFAPVLQQVVNLAGNQQVDFNGGFNKPKPGDIVISEFRNRGPAGTNDEFIEIYNNTDTDFAVSTDDESQGWTVVLNNGYNVIVIPNGTVLKARQHFAGTQFYVFYSGVPSVVNNYMGPRDSDWGYFDGFELPDDRGLSIFKTNNPANFTNSYRLDAVGFSTMPNSLYKEGGGLPPMGTAQPEYSFVRRMTGFTAQDTDNNVADFVLVATDGGIHNGIQSVLGAPGPETRSSPIRANLPGVCGLTKSLLDSGAPADSGANLVAAGGTLSVRRKITNGSGTTITRVRFRVVDISTLGNRGPGEADLRVISSTDTTATLSNGTTVTVKGTTLDQPPAQPNGGGLNSSLSVALPPGELAPGASINVQFLLNVVQPGTYRFEIDVPETPCDTTVPATTAALSPAANAAGWNNSDATVSLNATDNASGSGIKEISYVVSGGQFVPFTTVNSSTVNIPITAEGQTIITYFARDNASNTESPRTFIVRVDKTAPVIADLPAPIVEAADMSGAAVSWSGPTVTDNLDSSPLLSCSRASGSFFPIGVTTVTCSSSDQAGNSSATSFPVTVNPPADSTAPVTVSSTSPAANAVGWNNANVMVSLSASDNTDGSGVSQIIYSASGAQAIALTTVSGASANFVISAEGETTVTYFARDIAGNSESAQSVVIRIDKTAPVISNMPSNRTVTATGANGVSVSWDSPTVADNLDPSVSVTCLPAAGSVFAHGINTVTCASTDRAGNAASRSFTVEVLNAPPTADAGGPYQAGEGGAVALAGAGADAEGAALTYEWDLDDNGSFETVGQNPSFSAAGLDGPASRTVKLRVTDAAGLSAVSSATVNILNVAPTLNSVVGPVAPQAVNTQVNVTLNYTDPAGALDAYTPTVHWGDGTTDNNTSHTYSAAGVYRVRATVADEDGGVSNEAVYEYVVIYDPEGGFVTGGGWIASPAGAYAPNPTLTGRANFGFVSKYQRGADAPTGNTEFQFQTGGFRFKSDAYEWLVVAGSKAQFKGTGSINGVSGYRFMLTARDGQAAGGGGVDKFRIKIWNDGGVIYDNVRGEADDAEPQALGGGSIVVHRDN
jgi:hypothetical protein